MTEPTSAGLPEFSLKRAAELMEQALELLDSENDPANVTPHLDLALSRLREFLERTGRPNPIR